MNKILKFILMLFISTTSLSSLLLNSNDDTINKEVSNKNLENILKNYFIKTILPIYNLKNAKSQLRIIINNLIKETFPDEYKKFTINKLEFHKDKKNIFSDNELEIWILKNQQEFLRTKIIINLQLIIDIKEYIYFEGISASYGESIFVQEIDNNDSDSIKLFIVTKSGGKYYFNYLFLDQCTMKIKNYFTILNISELKFKDNQNDLDPIFIVNRPSLIKEKVDEILYVYASNGNFYQYFLDPDNTIKRFKDEISISASKNSQIHFSYWYNKVFFTNYIENKATLNVLWNDGLGISKVDIPDLPVLSNEYIVFDKWENQGDPNFKKIIPLFIGIDENNNWMAYKLKCEIETNFKIINKFKLNFLKGKNVNEIINWSEDSNTLAYIVDTNVGQRLEIANINTNEIIYISPIIDNYYWWRADADVAIQINYVSNDAWNNEKTHKQLISKVNKFINIASTNDYLETINTFEFAIIK